MKKSILLILFIFLLINPLMAQDDVETIDFLIYRLDYQSNELKLSYYWNQEVDMTESVAVLHQYHGLDVRIQPATDFGGTSIHSTYTNQLVYKATTVWDGTGKHGFPGDEYMIEEPGNTQFFQSDPEFIDLETYFFSNEDRENWRKAWEVVQQIPPPNYYPVDKQYGVLCYLHYFSVGISDPTTAEWIFIIYTIPTGTIPNNGYQ